jgi:hypothetical protein
MKDIEDPRCRCMHSWVWHEGDHKPGKCFFPSCRCKSFAFSSPKGTVTVPTKTVQQ